MCLDSPAGLLGRWPGDGTTADVAHGRDGTLVLGTTYQAGTVNQAFSFDGGDDQVTVPDDPDWTIDGDFTIDTWVTMDDLSGESKVFVGQSVVRSRRSGSSGAATTGSWASSTATVSPGSTR